MGLWRELSGDGVEAARVSASTIESEPRIFAETISRLSAG